MPPDTSSPLYPDRPIRPLPRRRIRERLSPELASSIKYPPATTPITPLFIYPQSSSQEHHVANYVQPEGESEKAGGTQDIQSLRKQGYDNTAAVQNLQNKVDSDIFSSRAMQSRTANQIALLDQRLPLPSTSIADGYDLIENANNKKKRKIPSAGDACLTPAQLVRGEVDGNQSGVLECQTTNSKEDKSSLANPSARYTVEAQGIDNQGKSGAGRGRLGRLAGGRSPLRTLTDGNSSRFERSKGSTQQKMKDYGATGVITSAIANAEKPPASGEENTGRLLRRHSITNKITPTASQFTFTCSSQVPGTIQWSKPPSQRGINDTAPMASTGRTHGESGDQENQRRASSGGPHFSRRSQQHTLAKELRIAADRRKQSAAESYYHNPPKLQDIWICEFCEYERIFGIPPRALIRSYEIRDRRRQLQMADRRRLREKAKGKGKKSQRRSGSAKRLLDIGPSSGNSTAESHLAETADAELCHSTQSNYEDEDDSVDSDGRMEADATPSRQKHQTQPG